MLVASLLDRFIRAVFTSGVLTVASNALPVQSIQHRVLLSGITFMAVPMRSRDELGLTGPAPSGCF